LFDKNSTSQITKSNVSFEDTIFFYFSVKQQFVHDKHNDNDKCNNVLSTLHIKKSIETSY